MHKQILFFKLTIEETKKLLRQLKKHSQLKRICFISKKDSGMNNKTIPFDFQQNNLSQTF